jgi:hypothetical protein
LRHIWSPVSVSIGIRSLALELRQRGRQPLLDRHAGFDAQVDAMALVGERSIRYDATLRLLATI